MSGKVFPGSVSGAPRYLDSDEEEELVDFLLGSAEVGYPKTVKEVRAIVGSYLASKHNQENCCKPWVVGEIPQQAQGDVPPQ